MVLAEEILSNVIVVSNDVVVSIYMCFDKVTERNCKLQIDWSVVALANALIIINI